MFTSSLIVTSILSSIMTANAQCATPDEIPCLPNGSQLDDIPTDSYDNTIFWANLQSIDGAAILRRRDLVHRLAARQNTLCCSPDPDVQCLVMTDENVPFCYNQQTTQFVFPDNSFGYNNNNTYYASDGTFVDFNTGYYSSADGTEGTFAPATAAASSTGAPSAVQTEIESLSSLATMTHAGSAESATNTEAATKTATQRPNSNAAATQTQAASQSNSGAVGARGAAAIQLISGFCGLFTLL